MAQRLPLFPLGTVLVPGLVLPLHIFEPRYRQLVADLEDLPEDEREFGVVAIREGGEVGVGQPAGAVRRGLRRHAAAGHDRAGRPQPDPLDRRPAVPAARPGHRRRRRRTSPGWSSGWTRSRATLDPTMALRSRALWARYTELLGGFGPQVVQDLPEDPGPLSYLLTTAVVMPLHQRQGLLAAPTDAARLAAVNRLPALGGRDHVGRAVTAPAGRGRPAQLSRRRPARAASVWTPAKA